MKRISPERKVATLAKLRSPFGISYGLNWRIQPAVVTS